MRRGLTVFLLGTVVLISTAVLYFVILGNIFFNTMQCVTLAGVLLAECVTLVFALFTKGDLRKIASITVSALMIPVSILMSCVFISWFPLSYFAYVGIYAVLFILLNVVTFILFFNNAKRTEENIVFANAKNNMLDMRKLVKCIMCDTNSEVLKNKLGEVEEKLHFSNDSVIVEQDAEIHNMLLQLQTCINTLDYDDETEAYKIDSDIEKLIAAIDKRNILSRNSIV